MACVSNSDDYSHVEDNCQILKSRYLSNVDADSGPPMKKAKKPFRSNAWNYFVKIGVGQDGRQKCKCKACGKVYSWTSSTSTLNSHILKCPMSSKSRNVEDKKIDHRQDGQLGVKKLDQNVVRDLMTRKIDHHQDGQLGVKKLDQNVVRDLMTRMIIQHDLPLQFVEWEGFRAFTKYISSDEIQYVSKDTVIADVMKVYLLEKEKLKNQLARISAKVCLTLHCWTNGYIALVANYIDEDWKLNIKLLNFFHMEMEPSHEEFSVLHKIFDCLEEWGIKKKIFSVTLDNISFDASFQALKESLCFSNSLLSNGDFFGVKCGAHFLDLIVEEGLKEASVVLHKIRKSVKYVSESEYRLKQFYRCVDEAGSVDSTVGLHLDVSSTWRSTYMMLRSAIKYRAAFECLHLNDTSYRHCPLDEAWARVEKICEFLWPFYDLTSMISESTYPTSTTYIRKIWMIMIRLKQNMLSDDVIIRDMASKMMDEFDKYLSEHSMILAFGCVLHPRLKFQFLKCVYSKFDSNIEVVEEKLRNVRKALDALINKYAKKHASTSRSCSTSSYNRKRERTIMDEIREYEEKQRQKAYAAGKTQLDLYLEEPVQPNLDDSKVLEYWKNQSDIFCDLAMMARDILSIPIMTVPSNSAFSIGDRIWNTYNSKNLQAFICTRNWLFGFSHCDKFGDVIEETHKIDINLYKHDSKVIVSDENENEQD